MKFALVSLVGCGFLAMIIYGLWMREEIRDAQIEPPLIAAPEMPVKRRPEEPGGMEIPNRDKLVFDLLESETPNQAVPSESVAVVEAEQAPVETPLAEETVAAPAAVVPVKPVVAMPKVVPVDGTDNAALAAKVDPKVVAKVAEKPAAKLEVKPEPQPEPKVAAKGNWGVQVGAVGTKAEGEAFAKKLQAKHAALKPLTPRVTAVTTGGSTKYRVQFIGVASRAAASAVCGKLRGQACFAVGG